MAPWKRFSKSKVSLAGEGMDRSDARTSVVLPETSEWGESDMLQSMNSSLQQTNRDQETRIRDQNQEIYINIQTIKRLEEEKTLLESQVWKFSENLIFSHNEIDAMRTGLTGVEDNMQALRAGVRVKRGELRIAEEKINEQKEELGNRSNTIQILSGHNQKLQTRVADMESLMSLASRDTGNDFQVFYTHYAELKAAHGEMALKVSSETAERLALNSHLTELLSEDESFKTVIDELQKEAVGLEVCQPQSLRALLT
jgi:hypothetical protein